MRTKARPRTERKMKAGTTLGALIAAGALANARTFGGQDYTGYHAFMALMPAYQMAKELPEQRRPLPVLKLLHRSSNRIQEHGGRKSGVLHPVAAEELPKDRQQCMNHLGQDTLTGKRAIAINKGAMNNN